MEHDHLNKLSDNPVSTGYFVKIGSTISVVIQHYLLDRIVIHVSSIGDKILIVKERFCYFSQISKFLTLQVCL